MAIPPPVPDSFLDAPLPDSREMCNSAGTALESSQSGWRLPRCLPVARQAAGGAPQVCEVASVVSLTKW